MQIRIQLSIPISDPLLCTVNADKANSQYSTEQVAGLWLVHLCIVVQKQFLLWIPPTPSKTSFNEMEML